MKDQKKPRTDPRYRAFSSRATRLWIRPRQRTSCARLRSIDLQDQRRDVIGPASGVGRGDELFGDVVQRRLRIGQEFSDAVVRDNREQSVRTEKVALAWARRDFGHVHLGIVTARQRA